MQWILGKKIPRPQPRLISHMNLNLKPNQLQWLVLSKSCHRRKQTEGVFNVCLPMLHRRPPGGSSRSRLRSDMILIQGCVLSLRFPCLMTLLTLQVGLMAEDTVVGVKHFAEQASTAASKSVGATSSG